MNREICGQCGMPLELRDEVERLKQEVKDNFNAGCNLAKDGERFRLDNERLRRRLHSARLVEAEARYQRVMAVIRPLCAKYAPDLLAEFDAATASTVSGEDGR